MFVKSVLVFGFVAVAVAVPLESKPKADASLPGSNLTSNSSKLLDELMKDKSQNETIAAKNVSMEVPMVRRSPAEDMKPLAGGKNVTLNATNDAGHKIKERDTNQLDKELNSTLSGKPENGLGNISTTTTTKKPARRDADHKLDALVKGMNNSSSLPGKNESDPKKKITERDVESSQLSAGKPTSLNKTVTDEPKKGNNLTTSGKDDASIPAPPMKPSNRRRRSEYGSSQVRFAVRDRPTVVREVVREAPSDYDSVREAPVAVVKSSRVAAVREAPVAVVRSSEYESVREAPVTVVRSSKPIRARAQRVKAVVREEAFEEPLVIREQVRAPIQIRTPSYAAPSRALIRESSGYGDDSAILAEEEFEEIEDDSYAPAAVVKTAVRSSRYRRAVDKPLEKDPSMDHLDNKVPDGMQKKKPTNMMTM